MASSRRRTKGICSQQVRRRFGAVGLVLGELLHAVRRLAALENRRDVRGRVLLRQLAQHVVEDVDRFGGEPVLVRIGGAPLRARAW